MKKVMPLLLSLLLLAGCSVPVEKECSYCQITMDKSVAVMEEEKDYIVLDVRNAAEFNDKHIPGAINIPT